jgi:hypothetical protein
MSSPNHTFIDSYLSYEISVLALSRAGGWIIEVGISGRGEALPVWRDSDSSYGSLAAAREAGVKWARARIDGLSSRPRA